MAEEILSEHGDDIASFTLIPSSGGRFEITIDGDLIYSKLETGRFPDTAEIAEQVRARG